MLKTVLAALLLALPHPATALVLDDARWTQLNQLAAAIFELGGVSDETRFGRREYWQVADAAGGDCEDKALLARARLIAAGWPPETLRLALAWTETREYHAVLTVDVVRGGAAATYVIDNRFPWPVAWNALSRHGYRWDRRQRGTGWVRISS